jgi:hypothetical protein
MIKNTRKRITLFISIAVVLVLVILLFLDWSKLSYRFIVDSGNYKKYQSPTILQPYQTHSYEFINPITGNELKEQYEKSFCCKKCQCDPAKYISVLSDNKENVYWVHEYELGPGSDLSNWYGPFNANIFNRNEKADIRIEHGNNIDQLNDLINIPSKYQLEINLPKELSDYPWIFNKDNYYISFKYLTMSFYRPNKLYSDLAKWYEQEDL